MLPKNSTEHMEPEYMEKDGRLCISHATEAQYLNESIGAQAVRQPPQMHISGSDTSRFLHLAIASPSLSILFRFEDDSRFQTHLAYEEIEIKVRALGVGELQRQGGRPWPTC